MQAFPYAGNFSFLSHSLQMFEAECSMKLSQWMADHMPQLAGKPLHARLATTAMQRLRYIEPHKGRTGQVF